MENKNKKEEQKMTKKQEADTNTIFVGSKPVMNYVMAVLTQVNGGQKEISIEARGRAISRAVDVVEIVKNKFNKNIKPTIQTSTEQIKNKDGHQINVSKIKIDLATI